MLSIQVSAKGNWLTGIGSTFGYNTKELQLWKYTAYSTFSRGLYFKIGYNLYINKNLSVSLEPGIQQHHDIIEINNTKVSGYSYNYDVPIKIHYQFLKKWVANIGITIQDYRAIQDIALNKSYNARVNAIFGLAYQFHNYWALELAYSRIISEKVDSFLFKNYSNHIHFGVSVNLQILKKVKP